MLRLFSSNFKKMKIYNCEELQVLIDGIEGKSSNFINELVSNFPFNEMINLSILDDALIRKYVEFLIKLTDFPYLFEKIQALQDTLYFIWNNFGNITNCDIPEVLTDLLILFDRIIYRLRNSNCKQLHELIISSKNIVIKAISEILKSKCFNRTHCEIYGNIICNLITLNGFSNDETEVILKNTFQTFRTLSAINQLAVITNFCVKTLYNIDDVFHLSFAWLMVTGIEYITKDVSVDIILQILQGINICIYYDKLNHWNYFIKAIKKFTKNLQRLLTFVNCPILKKESLLLIAFVLSTHLKTDEEIIFNELNTLPEEIISWSKSKSKLFFIICSLICNENDSLIWSPQKILQAIKTIIHSSDKFLLDAATLKSLCFLYSVLYLNFNGKGVYFLSSELLVLIIKNLRYIDKILSLHPNQLAWILVREPKLRKRVILHWLKHGNVDILADHINKTDCASDVHDLLLDYHLDPYISHRLEKVALEVVKNDTKLSIPLLIPEKYKNRIIMPRLFRLNSSLHRDELMIKFCEFLLRLSLFIGDENGIKMICKSILFMTSGIFEANIFRMLYENKRYLQFLIYKINHVRDDTAFEIITLVKGVLYMEKANHIDISPGIEIDLTNSLKRSKENVLQCLKVIANITRSKNMFIQLNGNNFRCLFLTLLNICNNSSYRRRSFACITLLLKRNPCLTFDALTLMFIELYTSVTTKSCLEMLEFFLVWLKIAKGTPEEQINAKVKNFDKYLKLVYRHLMITFLK